MYQESGLLSATCLQIKTNEPVYQQIFALPTCVLPTIPNPNIKQNKAVDFHGILKEHQKVEYLINLFLSKVGRETGVSALETKSLDWFWRISA